MRLQNFYCLHCVHSTQQKLHLRNSQKTSTVFTKIQLCALYVFALEPTRLGVSLVALACGGSERLAAAFRTELSRCGVHHLLLSSVYILLLRYVLTYLTAGHEIILQEGMIFVHVLFFLRRNVKLIPL